MSVLLKQKAFEDNKPADIINTLDLLNDGAT